MLIACYLSCLIKFVKFVKHIIISENPRDEIIKNGKTTQIRKYNEKCKNDSENPRDEIKF